MKDVEKYEMLVVTVVALAVTIVWTVSHLLSLLTPWLQSQFRSVFYLMPGNIHEIIMTG